MTRLSTATKMKKLLKTFILFTFIGNLIMTQSVDSDNSIYDIPLHTSNGEPFSLSDLKGKKILIVNVASKCGYTSQYKDLQILYETHSDKIEIIAFPCNDFGGQEPGSNAQISEFCSVNYGVKFPIMNKVSIKKGKVHPIYEWLTDPNLNGWNSTSPSWNFGKYLLDEKGDLLKYYSSSVSPTSDKIITQL